MKNKIRQKKEKAIKIKKKEKKRITETKIKKLLNIEHLGELFYLLHLLNAEDIGKFIMHYKESKVISKDERVDRIIRNSKDSKDLFELLKKELIEELNEEYAEIRGDISVERKKGKDVYIEDIASMSIPLKIRMFNATSEKRDYYKVKKLLHRINKLIERKKLKEYVDKSVIKLGKNKTIRI